MLSNMAAPLKAVTLELFYDVVSPYSWVAFEILTRYRIKWNLNIQFRPFFLSGIMAGASNNPHALENNKFKYIAHDVARLSNYCNIPLRQPKDVVKEMYVKGTLVPMRFITAVDMETPKYTEELSRQLWLRIWSRNEDITEPQSLLEAAKQAGIPEAQAQNYLSRVSDQDVKDRLKAYTARALDKGAFGAPTILLHSNGDEKLFFGSDRFDLLAHTIGKKYEGPLPVASKI